MVLWTLVIILIVTGIHELAHRQAYRDAGYVHHQRNRLAWLDSFLDFGSIKEGKRYTWQTLDYWKFPKHTSAKKRWRVGLSGVVRGVLLAWFIFTVLALINMPLVFENQFSIESQERVIRDDVVIISVDEASGTPPNLDTNTQPISVGTESIRNRAHFLELSQHFSGRSAELIYSDLGTQVGTNINFNEQGDSGITVADVKVSRYGISAIFVGLITTMQMMYFIISALWGGATDLGHGLDVLMNGYYLGFAYGFFFLGFLSLAYSLINLIPIPPFDLGRLLFREKSLTFIRRKPQE